MAECESVENASEAIFEIICGPCNLDGEVLQAEGYCSDCQDYLCDLCLKTHLRPKPWRHHVLLDEKTMPKDKMATSSKASDICTERCEKHSANIIEYYCQYHDFLGCSKCFISDNHRKCDGVLCIQDTADGIFDSQEFTNFDGTVEQLSNVLSERSSIQQQHDENIKIHSIRAITDIKNFRKNMNEYLDRLENEMERQVKKSKLMSTSKQIGELEKNIKTIKDTIERTRNLGQKSNMYIYMKRNLEQLKHLQDRIETVKNDGGVSAYTFTSNAYLQKIKEMAKTFGMLAIMDEHLEERAVGAISLADCPYQQVVQPPSSTTAPPPHPLVQQMTPGQTSTSDGGRRGRDKGDESTDGGPSAPATLFDFIETKITTKGGGRDGGGRGDREGGRGGGGVGKRYDHPEYWKDRNSEPFRRLFITGLDNDTTEDALRNHFGKWGEIVEVFVMNKTKSKTSRRFGFIIFKETSSIEMAQARDNPTHRINGREVESKRGMPRYADGQGESSVSTKKMFVGGVKEGDTEDDITNLFSQEGAVEQVRMVTDKDTGKLKPFCFVTFEETDITDKCVLIHQFDCNGHNLQVQKADETGGGGSGSRRDESPKPFSWADLASKNAPGSVPSATKVPIQPQQHKMETTASGFGPRADVTQETSPNGPKEQRRPREARFPDSHRLFVANLPPNVLKKDLRIFFEEFGHVGDLNIISKSESGKTPVANFAFVDFDSPETVQTILNNKPIKFNGRRLNVEKKKPRGSEGRSKSRGPTP